MIARLTGKVVECAPGEVVLDVGGVGYGIQIPLHTYYDLAAGAGTETVTLQVHTHVREDVLQLFGFVDLDEKRVFETLIGISGVGPRMALAILSGIGARELRAAVEAGDRQRLQKIPGVGKKTAERLLLELRDRLRSLTISPGPPAAGGVPGGGGQDVRDDAVSALLNLGYSRDAADKAVERAWGRPGGPGSLQELLRAALGRLID